ncbi:hypothetical protein K438DRAFT_1972977 [Mycena galopus ATCC 62051]|nr:hypothetical protein K438DRAFT_1972977 [Mycena galopus ATCC 62051]
MHYAISVESQHHNSSNPVTETHNAGVFRRHKAARAARLAHTAAARSLRPPRTTAAPASGPLSPLSPASPPTSPPTRHELPRFLHCSKSLSVDYPPSATSCSFDVGDCQRCDDN